MEIRDNYLAAYWTGRSGNASAHWISVWTQLQPWTLGNQGHNVWPRWAQGSEWDGTDSQDTSRHGTIHNHGKILCTQEKAKDKAKNVEGKNNKG
jgi:hypothetical protein